MSANSLFENPSAHLGNIGGIPVSSATACWMS